MTHKTLGNQLVITLHCIY